MCLRGVLMEELVNIVKIISDAGASVMLVGLLGFYIYKHFIQRTKEDEYESNGKIYCKEGETWENDEVQVIGQGNINFFTTQTGL